MITQTTKVVSRRSVISSAVTSAGMGIILRDELFGASEGGHIVQTMLAEATSAKITIRAVRRNISILDGSGGNIAVLTGRNGKLLVDSGYTASKSALSKAINSLGPDPVRHLVNTHWHIDHTDGNAWLHEAGASIVAHENTRHRMSVATRVEGWEHTFPAAPAKAIPSVVFRDQHKLQVNDTNIELRYYGPCHTDSDISVYFAEADVLHVGDTWWNGIYPFIDYSTGGSIDGAIRAAEANIAAAARSTIVIPGHGAPGGRSDLIEFRDMLATIREKVATLKKQGRSLSEVIAAKPTDVHDARWGQFLITPRFFTAMVYQGV